MPRKKQLCVRLSDEEFERVENTGLSPRDLVLKACELISKDSKDDLAGKVSVESTEISDINSDTAKSNEEEEEELGYDDGFEVGKRHGFNGLEKDEALVEGADDYSEGYNAGYDEGLSELNTKTEEESKRLKQKEEEAAKKRDEEITKIAEQNIGFLDSFDFKNFGRQLKEKFPMLKEEERNEIVKLVPFPQR